MVQRVNVSHRSMFSFGHKNNAKSNVVGQEEFVLAVVSVGSTIEWGAETAQIRSRSRGIWSRDIKHSEPDERAGRHQSCRPTWALLRSWLALRVGTDGSSRNERIRYLEPAEIRKLLDSASEHLLSLAAE